MAECWSGEGKRENRGEVYCGYGRIFLKNFFPRERGIGFEAEIGRAQDDTAAVAGEKYRYVPLNERMRFVV